MNFSCLKLRVIITQIKREIWENKNGFVYAPLIMSGLILVLLNALILFADIFSGVLNATWGMPGFFGFPIRLIVIAHSRLLSALLFFVLVVYSHSCLDDRKNRNILFWRSMPVSETTNVLVKLGILTILSPAIIFVLNLVVGLATFLVTTVIYVFKGSSIFTIISSVVASRIYWVPMEIFVTDMLQMILLAPIFSFILFFSAYAKKIPVIASLLIPLLLLAVDRILQITLNINLHLVDALSAYWQSLVATTELFNPGRQVFADIHSVIIYAICALLTVGLITATIWFRNNRYEL